MACAYATPRQQALRLTDCRGAESSSFEQIEFLFTAALRLAVLLSAGSSSALRARAAWRAEPRLRDTAGLALCQGRAGGDSIHYRGTEHFANDTERKFVEEFRQLHRIIFCSDLIEGTGSTITGSRCSLCLPTNLPRVTLPHEARLRRSITPKRVTTTAKCGSITSFWRAALCAPLTRRGRVNAPRCVRIDRFPRSGASVLG